MVAKRSGWSHIRDPPSEKNPREMIDWPNELDQDSEVFDAWAADERQPRGFTVYPANSPTEEHLRLLMKRQSMIG